MTWPGTTGLPSPSSPAPWIATYAFPFSQAWVYSGANAALLDFQFTGGKLSNNRACASNSRQSYYMDAPLSARSTVSGCQPTNPATCKDSGQARFAHSYPWFIMYAAKNSGSSVRDNMVSFELRSYRSPSDC